MYKQSAPQLRLKPSRLGRHEKARIRHSEEFGYVGGVHGEGHLAIQAATTLQLGQAADSADAIDAIVGFWILDAKNWIVKQVLH